MKRPNIVMVLTDQMHKYALGSIRDYVVTPNLDKLTEEGLLFSNAYSNNPVCGPYRGCLFTGMYSSENGVIENSDPLLLDNKTLADTFNDAGYESSFVGKWHLGGMGNEPIEKEKRGGFTHFFGYQCYNGFRKNVCFYDENNKEHKFDEHRTDVTTDIAVDRLEMLVKGDKPFIHVVFYQAPHYPVQPSERFEKMYEEKEIPLAPNYQEVDPYTQTYSPPSPQPLKKCKDYSRYGNDMQEYLRLYYAMVSQIDDGVGKIVDMLERLKIKDNTMIIFSSDHGDMQGSHGFKNKCLPYEESCGVPLIISAPDCKKGKKVLEPVSAIDLFPTCLDYAGIKKEDFLSGRSITPFIFGEEIDGDIQVIAESFDYETPWEMIRSKKHKLVMKKEEKEACMLFDMENDPYEMNNIVNDKAYLKVKNKMTLDLLKWRTDRKN